MSLELDMSSVVKIFDLLDVDKTRELELVAFVEGCIKLRGGAKVVDLSILHQDSRVSRVAKFILSRRDTAMINRIWGNDKVSAQRLCSS